MKDPRPLKERVWAYLDGETSEWPQDELNAVACFALGSWNRKGWITDEQLDEAAARFWEVCATGKLRRDVAPQTFFTVILKSVLHKHYDRVKNHKDGIVSSPMVEYAHQTGDLSLGAKLEIEHEDQLEYILDTAGRVLESERTPDDKKGAPLRRFIECVVNGRTAKDVAEEEGVCLQAVSASVRRSLKKMREALSAPKERHEP